MAISDSITSWISRGCAASPSIYAGARVDCFGRKRIKKDVAIFEDAGEGLLNGVWLSIAAELKPPFYDHRGNPLPGISGVKVSRKV